jgi:MFS family permease
MATQASAKAPSVEDVSLPISATPSIDAGKRKWYRSTLFNAFVIGSVGFLAPGLWNAMNDLGAGGALDPYLVNAANALVFGIMGFFCLFGGPIANRIGFGNTLFLGAVGYPIYSAGLYTNVSLASTLSDDIYLTRFGTKHCLHDKLTFSQNRYGNVWLVLVGAVCCGVSAGLFWVSEGAVALGYPEPGKRGKYMNIWLWFRTGGPLVGGAIVLALNNNAAAKKKGKVGYQVYLVFIALQCLACPLALALSPPEKVQRNDGSKVVIDKEKSFKAEFKALWRVSKRKDVLLLLPIFYAAYFNQYSSNFKSYYFGVRARALMGFVSNFGTLLSSQLISQFLDYKKLTVKKRITYGFFYVIFLHIVAWIYGWIIQEKYTKSNPVFDWEDSGFVEAFFVIILWDFARQALQNWLYYLLATKTDNISELSRFAGVLRGQESFGQAVAFGLNTKKWKGGRVPLGVTTALLVLSVYPTWLVVRDHVPVEAADAKAPVDDLALQQVVTLEEKRKFVEGEAALGRNL